MKTIYFLLGFLFTLNTFALVGAVSSATGGTGRGAVEPIDGVLLNPATVSDLPTKNFSVNYSAEAWAMTVTDNGKDVYIPAALRFVKSKAFTTDTQQLGLSFASRRWKKFAIGGTASMMEYTDTLTGTTEQKYRQTTMDLAATYAAGPTFGIGFVANKVASSKITLIEGLQAQQTLALGLSYTYQNFARIKFDVESAPDNRTDKLNYMLGFENYLNDWVVVRMGVQQNKVLAKDYISAGLGFAGPQFGLHYAFISNTADKTEDKHLIDLGFPF